mmetsp:Transcript_4050/g.8322  ORF Transcript_4050/g.8322 Transcript_4050/m.8322 type:complete len:239 (+) Transcript_4050:138-854(+)
MTLASISTKGCVPRVAPLRQRIPQRTTPLTYATRGNRGPARKLHSGTRCSNASTESEDKTSQKVDWSRAKPLLLEMKASFAEGGLAPPWVEAAEPRARLRSSTQKLAALAVYGDEEKTFEEDMQFYQQGTDLFVRDFKRDFPRLRAEILGTLTGETPSFSSAEEARIRRLRADMLALVPFAFICMNTVPLTPAIMPTILRYVPRQWVLPSSFEEERLRPMKRLQKQRSLVALRQSGTP